MPQFMKATKEDANFKWNMTAVRKVNGVEKEVRYAKLNEAQLREEEIDSIADALVKQASRGEFDTNVYKDKDGNTVQNSSTGFNRFVKEKEGKEVRASRGEDSVEKDIKASQRRSSGKTGFAGFKPQAEEGSDYHDEDRQDFEKDRNDSSGTGPVGFGLGPHGTPEDEYPEERDKAEPYGGNAIGGSVGKKSRFRIPPEKEKVKDDFDEAKEAFFRGNDGDNDDLFTDGDKEKPDMSHQREAGEHDLYLNGDPIEKGMELENEHGDSYAVRDVDQKNNKVLVMTDNGRRVWVKVYDGKIVDFDEAVKQGSRKQAGSGTTLEEGDRIDTVTPIQSESPRTETLQDQYHYDLLPQEPGRIDVPGHDGGGKDMQDPFGSETEDFEFNEEGDPSLPGKSQDYPDKKVRVTPIEGSDNSIKKIVDNGGRIYTGEVVKADYNHVYLNGRRVGDVTNALHKIPRNTIQKVSNYSITPKTKHATTSLSSLYDEVGGQEKKMGQVIIAKGGKCRNCGEQAKSLDSDGMCVACSDRHKEGAIKTAAEIEPCEECKDGQLCDYHKKKSEEVQKAYKDQDKFRSFKTADSKMEVREWMYKNWSSLKNKSLDEVEELAMKQGFGENDTHEVMNELARNSYKQGNLKTASDSILKKYFGLTGKADSLDKDDDIAHTEKNIKGDGELYGDDKALKDQLNFHESKMAKLKTKLAWLTKVAEGPDKEVAKKAIASAEQIITEMKNSNIRVSQIKKEASQSFKSHDKGFFFDNKHDGHEDMFL